MAGAKRAADKGPVLITDRGHPAYALLRIDDFYELGGNRQRSRSLLELMDGLPDTAGLDFEPPRLIDQPSAAVRSWAAHIRAEQFYLSAVVMLELWLGYELKARTNAPQAANLKVWIEGLEAASDGRTLPFTARGARLCAPLHVPDPRAWRDSVIAATALEHGMTLVTRNVRDFAGTGVRLVDPFV